MQSNIIEFSNAEQHGLNWKSNTKRQGLENRIFTKVAINMPWEDLEDQVVGF